MSPIGGGEFAVLQLQCHHTQMLFLQLRKILGLLIALARGGGGGGGGSGSRGGGQQQPAVATELLPDEYIEVALDENCVVPVPTAPTHLCYLAECEYHRVRLANLTPSV